jgi:hypothetical protein
MSFFEQRRKERQSGHVVEMAVSQKQIGIDDDIFIKQCISERAKPSATIENDHPVAAAQLEAWRVSAVARGPRARAGNAAAHAPELHTKSHLTSAVDSLAIKGRQAGRFVHARAFATGPGGFWSRQSD